MTKLYHVCQKKQINRFLFSWLKDYEIAVFEPFFEFLPSRPKTFFQRYGSLVYAHLIYCVMMPRDCVRRAHLWYLGKTKPRPENFIILLELLTYIYFAPSVWVSKVFLNIPVLPSKITPHSYVYVM